MQDARGLREGSGDSESSHPAQLVAQDDEGYQSSSSSSSSAGGSETDDHQEDDVWERRLGRRTGALRECLIWSAFVSGLLVEVAIHWRYGLSKGTFEAEEDCRLRAGDLPFRCQLLVFCEIICRICLTVVLAGMLWELGVAAVHRAGGLCLRRTFAGREVRRFGWGPLLLIMGTSGFVLCLGIWNGLAEDTMPMWAIVICHICDIFCHGIILSALAGIVFDLCLGALRGDILSILGSMAMCYDTIEAHGVVGGEEGLAEHKEAHFAQEFDSEQGRGKHTQMLKSEQTKNPASRAFGSKHILFHQRGNPLRFSLEIIRAALIWLSFATSLAAAVSSSYYPTTTPEWVGTATKLEGCCCWGGIAWWVSQSIVEWAELLGRSAAASLGMPSPDKELGATGKFCAECAREESERVDVLPGCA